MVRSKMCAWPVERVARNSYQGGHYHLQFTGIDKHMYTVKLEQEIEKKWSLKKPFIYLKTYIYFSYKDNTM